MDISIGIAVVISFAVVMGVIIIAMLSICTACCFNV